MHCPKCGQKQVSEETRFCSRCGFLLTGVAQVVANEGMVPATTASSFSAGSPRRRGVMQGAFVFLLSFLIVPLVAFICLGLGIGPEPVAVAAVVLSVGGILRAVYALMFESGVPTTAAIEGVAGLASPGLPGRPAPASLPASHSIPADAYAPPGGAWRDTNDLTPTPGSVTDNTTKLLSKDEERQ